MEKEKTIIRIPKNQFQNRNSEFCPHTTLNTSASLSKPFYAQITICYNDQDEKLIAVKTSSSIIVVKFNNTNFVDHRKLIFKDDRLDRTLPVSFTFRKATYDKSDLPLLVIGYKTGLIAIVDSSNDNVKNILNYDEKTKECLKKQAPNLIIPVPGSNDDEILVVFNDSTMMKYNIKSKTQNIIFQEKLKKFEDKITFKKKFSYTKKTTGAFTFGSLQADTNTKLNYFFARNADDKDPNPAEFIKFNCRTISDAVLIKNPNFSTKFNKNIPVDTIILALASYDGYLLIYDYGKLEPLFSFKSQFGGYNSLTISDNCDMIALSGHDDCITVIDMNTFGFIRCEGHKSFIGKTIFQTMTLPRRGSIDQDSDDNKEQINGYASNDNEDSSNWVRMIAGGLDGYLSVWEFEKGLLESSARKMEKLNKDSGSHKSLPFIIDSFQTDPLRLSPLLYQKMSDAIGWVELVGGLLILCTFDGYISTFIVKDYALPPESECNIESEENKDIKYKDSLINQSMPDNGLEIKRNDSTQLTESLENNDASQKLSRPFEIQTSLLTSGKSKSEVTSALLPNANDIQSDSSSSASPNKFHSQGHL